MGNFDLDLKFGLIGEKDLCDALYATGGRVEVKTERGEWMSTGNMAVELYGRNKQPSGLNTTEADWWFVLFKDNEKTVYIMAFPVNLFHKAVMLMLEREEARFSFHCGDDKATACALVPMSKISKWMQIANQ